MSIKHQIELNELRGRIELLEHAMNRLSTTPRTVSGMLDPIPTSKTIIEEEDKPVRKKPGPKPKTGADVA